MWSDQVEIFLEHRLLVVHTPTTFTTHVTDLTTLEPRRDGPLTYLFHQELTHPSRMSSPRQPAMGFIRLSSPSLNQASGM